VLYSLFLEDPAYYERLMEVSLARVRDYTRALDAPGVDILFVGGNVPGGFMGRKNYEQHILPWEARHIAWAQERGTPAAYHNCGQIQALASAPGTLTQHARDGRIRVLGCWGRERAPAFPDVPTFMERGFRDVEFYIWAGLFAPAATPAPVVARLRDAVRQSVQDPELVRAFTAAGAPVGYLDALEFARFFAEDSARLVAAVQKIGRVE
jgi:tripartite-type tricarboxylate transporter receptor subunit TctC